MVDNFLHFIIKKFIIIGILVPAILVYKYIVYRNLKNGSERVHDFFYYTYANIATTHNPQRKKEKQLQNTLFYILLILLALQFVISIPVMLTKP